MMICLLIAEFFLQIVYGVPNSADGAAKLGYHYAEYTGLAGLPPTSGDQTVNKKAY